MKERYKMIKLQLSVVVLFVALSFTAVTAHAFDDSAIPTITSFDEVTIYESYEPVLAIEGHVEQCSFVDSFIYPNKENNAVDVYNLQAFLVVFENEILDIDGIYGYTTQKAVKRFQGKYKEEVLTPWGLFEPTGNVYITTKKKINEIFCNKDLVLNGVEYQEMLAYKEDLHKDVVLSLIPNTDTESEEDTTVVDSNDEVGLIDKIIQEIDIDLEDMMDDLVMMSSDLENNTWLTLEDGSDDFQEPFIEGKLLEPESSIKDNDIKDILSDRDITSSSTVSSIDNSDEDFNDVLVVGDITNDGNSKENTNSALAHNQKDYLDTMSLQNSSGVMSMASSVVVLIEMYSLPLLIILILLLMVQLYILWKAPTKPLY